MTAPRRHSIGRNDGTSSYPAIWLNRFTPPAGSYPITLNQISIQFPDPSSAGIDLTGKSIDLLVYLDTDGNNDPSNATKLAQIHTTVLVANGSTFSNYPVNINVPGPGDIYIGFSDTYNSGGFNPTQLPGAGGHNQYQRPKLGGGNEQRYRPGLQQPGRQRHPQHYRRAWSPGNWVIRASGTTQCGP